MSSHITHQIQDNIAPPPAFFSADAHVPRIIFSDDMVFLSNLNHIHETGVRLIPVLSMI